MHAARSPRSWWGPTCLGALALLGAGCAGPDLTVAAQRSVAWALRVEDTAALVALFYAGTTHSGTQEAMVDDAITSIGDAMGPSCALSPMVEAATVTLSFARCTAEGASHGVHDLDGTLTASYTVNDTTIDVLGVALRGQGLTLNGEARDLDVAAGNLFPSSSWVTTPDNELAFRVGDQHPPSSNTENRDALLAFTGDYKPPGNCAEADASPPRIGAANGLVSVDDGEAWTISASGVERCGRRCPRKGTIAAQLEIALRIELDGTAAAQVENLGTGETVAVPLDCTP